MRLNHIWYRTKDDARARNAAAMRRLAQNRGK